MIFKEAEERVDGLVFKFQLLQLTDSFVLLEPCEGPAAEYYKVKGPVKFRKQSYTLDNSIRLEKIIYHSTSCFGTCPTIDMEINDSGQMHLYVKAYLREFYFEPDTARSGWFEGKLSSGLFNQMALLLKTCNLEELYFPVVEGDDGPVTTLIVYYNGKRKYLKSMFPPMITDSLIGFLYCLREVVPLKKTYELYPIEK